MNLLNNKLFKSVIFGIYTTFSIGILMSKNFNIYSFFYLILLLLIIKFYFSNNLILNKKDKKYSIIFALVLSLIMIIGNMVWVNELYFDPYQESIKIFTLQSVLEGILIFGGVFILFYYLGGYIFPNISKVNIYNKVHNWSSKKVFSVSFLIIMICYIPYFLRCYPALMSADSYVQINTVENGILTNLHPLLQTWFFGFIYKFGKLIFGTGNGAISFYIIFQMIVMSWIFAGTVAFLYKRNINIFICIFILLFFALSPLHAYYSVTLWKDILFSVNFIFILYSLTKLKENGFNIRNILLFVLSIVILLFFRNNGIYVLFVMIPFLLYFYKENFKKMLIICLFIISGYFIITGPIYKKIGVAETTSVEAYSIPLQQIARVIYLEQYIDDENMDKLIKLMDVDSIKNTYLPHISDNVKNSVNLEYFNEHKMEFFKIYVKLFFKHPVTYIESYLSQTLGFWYPDTVYHAISKVNAETGTYNVWNYGIKNYEKTPEIINKIIDKTVDKTIPFSIIFWSTGLYCILLFISILISVYNYKNTKKYFVLYSPFIGLWVTMMVASPVFAELRYIYGIFVCMLIIPFVNINKEKSSL